MKKKLLLFLFAVFFLTGCWDKVEIENRGFVISIGIDSYTAQKNEQQKKATANAKEAESETPESKSTESGDRKQKPDSEKKEPSMFEGETNMRYIVTMALPNISELAEKGSGGEGRAGNGENSAKAKAIKKSASETVAGGMDLIDAYSSQKFYYGHTKICVLGDGILKDAALFREAMDAVERNKEISRKIILLATKGTAEEILNADVTGEPLVGMFVSDFYKNNKYSINSTLRRDLEGAVQQLMATGNAIIPEISIENKEIKLGGLAIIKDYKLAGFMNDLETRGYLWTQKAKMGGLVTVPYQNTFVPLAISDKKTKIKFSEQGDHLVCHIDVEVEGNIDEYLLSDKHLSEPNHLDNLQKSYEAKIAEEIQTSFHKFQNEFGVDGLDVNNLLRKNYYDLYKKYNSNWDETFEKMDLETSVKVSIRGSGSIK